MKRLFLSASSGQRSERQIAPILKVPRRSLIGCRERDDTSRETGVDSGNSNSVVPLVDQLFNLVVDRPTETKSDSAICVLRSVWVVS